MAWKVICYSSCDQNAVYHKSLAHASVLVAHASDLAAHASDSVACGTCQ